MLELNEANAPRYLLQRNRIASLQDVRVASLGGGVSNTVLLVETPSERFVLKQSLPKLRVQDDWFADQTRIFREAECIRAMASVLGPGIVPDVLFEDRKQFIIAISSAPAASVVYKDMLISGSASAELASRAGEILSRMHVAAARSSELLTKFQDIEAFRQLRIDPYYGKISEVHPQFKPQVDALVAAMLSRRQTLVHGDYSPKNMLVTGQEIFLIDFEVVHCGDPSFDTAFFLNHLFLKALRFPEHQALYLQSVRNFWRSYAGGMEHAQRRRLEKHALEHLGCLLLARVDGKSPVEYITEERLKQKVRRLSQRVLLETPAELEQVAAWVGHLEPQM